MSATVRRCPSGKARHANLDAAKVSAHEYARELNRRGKLAESIYAYRCDQCRGGWHTTRLADWYGRPHPLVYEAAPEHLQRWAMEQNR